MPDMCKEYSNNSQIKLPNQIYHGIDHQFPPCQNCQCMVLELSNINRWRYWFSTVRQLYSRYICHYLLFIGYTVREPPKLSTVKGEYWKPLLVYTLHSTCSQHFANYTLYVRKVWEWPLDPSHLCICTGWITSRFSILVVGWKYI